MKAVIFVLAILIECSLQNQDSLSGGEFSSKVPIQIVTGYTFQRTLNYAGSSPFYLLKLGDSLAYATLCGLHSANYQGDLVINLNKENQIVDIDFKTKQNVDKECDIDLSETKTFTLNITTKLQTSVLAKSPLIEIVEQKVAKSEEEQPTSWFSKYWLYIAIFVLVIINSFVTGGQAPQNTSQNNRRPQ